MIFHHHHYSEKGKVKLIVCTFEEYALTWWNLLLSKRRSGNHAILTLMERNQGSHDKAFCFLSFPQIANFETNEQKCGKIL